MKKLAYVLIVSLILIFMVSSVFSQQKLTKKGSYYVAEFDKEFKVAEDGKLKIEDVTGDVNIKTWNKNLVRIKEVLQMDVYTKEEAEAVLEDAKTRYSQNGNTITIGGGNSYRSYMNSKYDITLPEKFNANVKTTGGDIHVEKLSGKAELKTAGGDIELNNMKGMVEATTAGGDVKVVKNTNSVQLKTSGGDIDIVDVMGEVDAKTSGGDITVRNNKAKVDVKTSGGDIRLENVGPDVSAKTSGGDIEINGTRGDISVSTSGGDVDIVKVNGVVYARTSGGGINVSNVETGAVVSTSGGDINLDDIRGYIEGSTSGGDIDARMTLDDFSRDHHVKLSSSAGDVTLRIPEKLPATISARINLRHGGWNSGKPEYDIKSDFKLNKDVEGENGDIEAITGRAKINGGGDLIDIVTSHGNIRILKIK